MDCMVTRGDPTEGDFSTVSLGDSSRAGDCCGDVRVVGLLTAGRSKDLECGVVDVGVDGKLPLRLGESGVNPVRDGFGVNGDVGTRDDGIWC